MAKHPLVDAANALADCTRDLLKIEPDENGLKRILLRFYVSFGSFVEPWLLLVQEKLVTKEGSEGLAAVIQKMNDLNLNELMRKTCWRALSVHGNDEEGKSACKHDHAAVISQGIIGSPFYGITALFLLNANAEAYSRWMIRHGGAIPMYYFAAYKDHHEEFSRMLLECFVCEQDAADENRMRQDIEKATLDVATLLHHVMKG